MKLDQITRGVDPALPILHVWPDRRVHRDELLALFDETSAVSPDVAERISVLRQALHEAAARPTQEDRDAGHRDAVNQLVYYCWEQGFALAD